VAVGGGGGGKVGAMVGAGVFVGTGGAGVQVGGRGVVRVGGKGVSVAAAMVGSSVGSASFSAEPPQATRISTRIKNFNDFICRSHYMSGVKL